jgi:hypothetical protein
LLDDATDERLKPGVDEKVARQEEGSAGLSFLERIEDGLAPFGELVTGEDERQATARTRATHDGTRGDFGKRAGANLLEPLTILVPFAVESERLLTQSLRVVFQHFGLVLASVLELIVPPGSIARDKPVVDPEAHDRGQEESGRGRHPSLAAWQKIVLDRLQGQGLPLRVWVSSRRVHRSFLQAREALRRPPRLAANARTRRSLIQKSCERDTCPPGPAAPSN